MSENRSNYSDYPEQNWQWICWRGAVKKAIKGKRGQAFLKELLTTLDNMPKKELIGEELVTKEGDVCAIGSVMVARGIVDASKINVRDYNAIAKVLDISEALVREIEYVNDEAVDDSCLFYEQDGKWLRREWSDFSLERWRTVRNWVEQQITEDDLGGLGNGLGNKA